MYLWRAYRSRNVKLYYHFHNCRPCSHLCGLSFFKYHSRPLPVSRSLLTKATAYHADIQNGLLFIRQPPFSFLSLPPKGGTHLTTAINKNPNRTPPFNFRCHIKSFTLVANNGPINRTDLNIWKFQKSEHFKGLARRAYS